MKMKHVLTGVIAVAAASLLGGSPIMGHADDDYNHAVATMPHGLPVAGYFNIPTFANSGVPNSAKTADSPTDETQAVQITNDANQVGSIWAARDKYYFDFTRDQQAAMWMYFGNKGTTLAGDGMAFVIQNDSRGEQAIATQGASSTPAVGQTLGVWGYASLAANENGQNVAKRAIQNSWALEFDTFANKQRPTSPNDIPGSFDFQLTGPHLTANYPAQSGTYTTMSFDTKYSYTQMNHGIDSVLYGGPLIKTPLSDGQWHHVTVDYKAPTNGTTKGTMTYTINDKQPASGAVQPKLSTTTTFDYSLLKDPDTTGTHPANTGRWGFTGSTGATWENNLVVFEQMPGLVKATGAAKIYNRSDKDSAGNSTEVTAGKRVTGGDRLQLDYQLNYDSGRVDWDNISAAVRLPDNVSVDSGTVTYANGNTETVDLKGLSGQNLSFKLGQMLNADNRNATVSLYGKAANPASESTVASQTSKFSGPNAIVTADTPSFILAHSNVDFNLKVTSDTTVSVASTSATPTITGNAVLTGSTQTSTGFTLHPNLNGKDLKTVPVTVTKDTAGGYTGDFSYQLPKDAGLVKGDNTLTLTATDDAGGYTSTVGTVTLNVGKLDWGVVNGASSFEDVTLTGTSQTVTRKGDWRVEVDNQVGTNWKMMAALTTPFTDVDTGNKLAGNLLYKGSATEDPVTMSPESVIVTDQSAHPASGTTDVSQDWKTDTGMLLEVGGGATAGAYQGQITWTLVNAE
ncbi:hypothetical protein [Levilactobacillus andaensis]|uniref:hypothetical protein n=1 Tax=Levilactobacillus andaensis TaxID=2799570 RepID=UPI001940E17A|nr:hypothetical protein [Levilactobacillus andaensis]